MRTTTRNTAKFINKRGYKVVEFSRPMTLEETIQEMIDSFYSFEYVVNGNLFVTAIHKKDKSLNFITDYQDGEYCCVSVREINEDGSLGRQHRKLLKEIKSIIKLSKEGK